MADTVTQTTTETTQTTESTTAPETQLSGVQQPETPAEIDPGIPYPTPRICATCITQSATQASIDAMKVSAQQLAQMQQMLSNLPKDLINDLDASIKKLMKIINGYEDPGNVEFDPTSIVASLTSVLDPIISFFKSIPGPSIPGLEELSALLKSLISLVTPTPGTGMSEAEINAKIPKRPQIPPGFLDTLGELLSALGSLMATLPLVLINLIFEMLGCIIGMFGQIAGVIGVPSIPYPLSLVPDVITKIPDVFKLVKDLPSQTSNLTKAITRKKLQESAALGIPDIPDSIESAEQSSCLFCGAKDDEAQA